MEVAALERVFDHQQNEGEDEHVVFDHHQNDVGGANKHVKEVEDEEQEKEVAIEIRSDGLPVAQSLELLLLLPFSSRVPDPSV